MFEKFDPRKGKMVRILKGDSTIQETGTELPLMTDDQLLKAYATMVMTREADEWAMSLNRQGRIPTYAPNKGQEANSVGSLLALRSDDWFLPSFRELGGMLLRNIPLRQLYLYWYGNERGSRLDRKKYHTLPMVVPIGSHAIHAVGISFAEKYYKSDKITIVFVGDGATSEGEFLEALNFAGVFHTPTIFFIQNNHWAISVPRAMQSASKTLAEKAFGFGFEGVQVDGNDVMAVYAATKLAAEKARKDGGPTLIEGVTYRLGPHTTSDDPMRYRDQKEVEMWMKRDPLLRLERYLLSKRLITEDEIEEKKKKTKTFVIAEFEAVEHHPEPTIEETFMYTYKDQPDLLLTQMHRRKQLKETSQA